MRTAIKLLVAAITAIATLVAVAAAPATPVAAAVLPSIAVGDDYACGPIDTFECWGQNALGQLGYSGAGLPDPTSVGNLPPGVYVAGVSAFSDFTCVVLTNGTTVQPSCFGANDHGQLGITANSNPNPTPQVSGPSGTYLGDIGTGLNHTCFVNTATSIDCWGQATSSQNVDQSTPTGSFSDLAVGGNHNCVILDTNVVCWGDNSVGQLGTTNSLGSSTASAQVAGVPSAAGAPVALASGRDHSCAVTDGGTGPNEVWCWGNNFFGQLGPNAPLGNATAPVLPIQVTLSNEPVEIATGWYHTCAITTAGTVECWGFNGAGNLGHQPPSVSFDPNPAAVPFPPSAAAMTAVDGGRRNTCSLDLNGTMYCWGFNQVGQIGNGTIVPSVGPGVVDKFIVGTPGSSTNVTATFNATNNYNTATLSWAAPAPTAGGPITSYQIEASTDNGTTWQLIEPGTGNANTTYTAGALTGGEDYVFRVIAVNQQGDGAASAPSNTISVPARPVPTITGTTVANTNPFTLTVTFDQPVTGFSGADLSWVVTGGLTINTATATQVTASEYTVSFDYTGSGSADIDVATATAAAVSSGAPNVGSAAFSIIVDPDAPTGTFGPQDVTNTTPLQLAFTTSEPVSGLDASDFDISGDIGPATVLSVTGGPTVWNITVQPTTPGEHIVTYTGNATDLAGNPLVATDTGNVVNLDGVPDIIPIIPERFVDTRDGELTVDGRFQGDGRIPAGGTYRFEVLDRSIIPDDWVAAVAINVTAVDPAAPGFLTIYPCDEPRPNASGLNYQPGNTRANEQIAKLSSDGEICVYSLAETDLVVDVNGVVPVLGELSPIAPRRLVDTRSGTNTTTIDGRYEGDGRIAAGDTYRFEVPNRNLLPPSGLSAAVVNVVAVNPTDDGFLTIYPCDEPRPNASGLNYKAGDTIANEEIIELSSDGEICVYSLAETDLVVDITAYTNPLADIIGINPTRVVDTRTGANNTTIDGNSQGDGRIAAGTVYEFDVAGRGDIPNNAAGVTVNVVAVNPDGLGYFTVAPCGDFPLASSLNYRAGDVISNEVLALLSSDGTLCIFTLAETDLVVDVTSYIELPPFAGLFL